MLILSRGAFVDVEEARAAALIYNPESSEQSAVRRSQNLFSLWDGGAEDLRKVMSKVPHYPNFASWAGEFSAWLIELGDKDVDVAFYHSEHAIVGTVADKSVVARLPPERLYGYASASPTAAAF